MDFVFINFILYLCLYIKEGLTHSSFDDSLSFIPNDSRAPSSWTHETTLDELPISKQIDRYSK